MDHAEKAQARPGGSARILIACARCKVRKIRCDGGRPKCGHCIARSAECNYAVVRNYRGPGKSKKNTERLAEPAQTQPLAIGSGSGPECIRPGPTSVIPPSTEISRRSWLHDGAGMKSSAIPRSEVALDSSQARMSLNRRTTIFPDFLLPGAYEIHLKTVKKNVDEANARQKSTPLMPLEISRRLIQNSFAEIMAEYQLLDMSSFLTLLDAQYAASSAGPAGNPARWAIVNAIIAVAVRFKVAPGSESQLSCVATAFYQNATSVIPELILQEPSLLSIQSMLAMAIFAKGIPDDRAYVMLTTNASRQLESLTIGCSTPGLGELMQQGQQFKQAYQIACMFNKDASLRFNVHPILDDGG